MSESKESENPQEEYKIDIESSHVMGFAIQNVEGTIVDVDLDGKLLNGQKITVIPIGDGKCKVHAEYEGKLDPKKLVAMTVYNTAAWKSKNINGKSSSFIEENGGCFKKIIALGALSVAVTLALSSCIKGCMAQPVEPTQPTETLVQETTMPDDPEYYDATVQIIEGKSENGVIYENILNPGTLNDMDNEVLFVSYEGYIGKIDKAMGELHATYSDCRSTSTERLERLGDLTYEISLAHNNQYILEDSARRKAEELRDADGNSKSEDALYSRQVEDIEKQQKRTYNSFLAAHNAHGVVVNISKAHQDLINGENYVKDVDFSFNCSVHRTAYSTIDYTELNTSGTIQSEYSETGKTQEELLQQVIEGLQEYEPYMEDDIVVKIGIVDDQGEEVDYISYSGTKEEIIENIKSDFGIQENSVENDGNGNIQSENEAETGEVAFSASDVKEVVAKQKTTGLRRMWNKFTHCLHRGQNRSDEGR